MTFSCTETIIYYAKINWCFPFGKENVANQTVVMSSATTQFQSSPVYIYTVNNFNGWSYLLQHQFYDLFSGSLAVSSELFSNDIAKDKKIYNTLEKE